jgi:hypothetical protein
LFQAWQDVIADGVKEGLFRADANDFLVISNIVRSLYGTADWLAAGAPRLGEAYSFDQVRATQCRLTLAWARRAERIEAPVQPDRGPEILGQTGTEDGA